VLPFEALGGADTTFTKGIHWEVLTRLSGVSGLDVIARSSVARYADPTRPLSEVAGELGAGWVLRGEVQQVAGRVQVHARLLDAGRGRQVWAEAFLRELTAANLFEIQREITRQIVSALETRLASDAPPDARRGSTDDLEAWRLYWQGRGLLVPRTEPSMRRAAEYFREALALDPEFAPAWAGLADALIYLDTFGFDLPAGSGEPRVAAERALQLDPDLAEGHFALANLAHASRNNREATRRAERAIELRPSFSDAFNMLSWIHKQHGRPEAGLVAAERAVDLDPMGSAPLSNLALAHLALNDPAAAGREARKIRDLHPDFSTGTLLEALAAYHQGRFRDAAALLEGLYVAWAPDASRATLGVAQVALGDSAAARETLGTIDRETYPFSAALVRVALGETGPAIDAIDRIETWEYWPTFAVRYFFPAVLRPLREDPRFERILEGVDASWR
jgi:TolB-like protein/Tfp pilus assembly protein PilF